MSEEKKEILSTERITNFSDQLESGITPEQILEDPELFRKIERTQAIALLFDENARGKMPITGPETIQQLTDAINALDLSKTNLKLKEVLANISNELPSLKGDLQEILTIGAEYAQHLAKVREVFDGGCMYCLIGLYGTTPGMIPFIDNYFEKAKKEYDHTFTWDEVTAEKDGENMLISALQWAETMEEHAKELFDRGDYSCLIGLWGAKAENMDAIENKIHELNRNQEKPLSWDDVTAVLPSGGSLLEKIIVSATAPAIVPITDHYQTAISDRDYEGAFSTKRNNHAYITVLRGGFKKTLNLEEREPLDAMKPLYIDGKQETYRNGEPKLAQDSITEHALTDLETLKQLDYPFLTQIMRVAAFCEMYYGPGYRITVNRQEFAKALNIRDGIEEREKHIDIESRLRRIQDKYVGIINGNSIYSLLTLYGADNPNSLTFESPYIWELRKVIGRKKYRQPRNKDQIGYIEPAYQQLMFETGSIKNKKALQIATCIINAVERRGKKPDSQLPQNKNKYFAPDDIDTVTTRTSAAELMRKIPLLESAYNNQDSTAHKYRELKRDFTAAYKVLKNNSDLFKAYKDVVIEGFSEKLAPTTRNLDKPIFIKHKGYNARYRHDKARSNTV